MAFDAADFIMRAGLGLEAEDRVLLGSHLVQGTHGGLLRLNNERYYQSIVWRALTPKYRVKTEGENRTDLIIIDAKEQYRFEMKRWMGTSGYDELPSINKDIDKLQGSRGYAGGIIIFSAQHVGETDKQMLWLEDEVPRLKAGTRYSHAFETRDEKNGTREFWIALWMLSPSASPASAAYP